jgi:REP element-mobilizing transposase RayT
VSHLEKERPAWNTDCSLYLAMKDENYLKDSEYPYHFSARTFQGLAFPQPLAKTWETFCKIFQRLIPKSNLEAHAFVLMPNHFHCLATAPQGNLHDVIGELFFQLEESEIGLCRRETGLLEDSFWATRIANPIFYSHVYKYVFRNPVDAGLCQRVEEYPFSTLYYEARAENPPFPLTESRYFFKIPFGVNFPGQHRWLNQQTAPMYLKRRFPKAYVN